MPSLIAALLGGGDPLAAQSPVRVRVQTELGDIVVEVDQAKAPATAANFLRYVDAGHYDGGTWHRTVKQDNQPESTIKIEVIQAGVNPDKAKAGFPAIALERTNVTGLLHKDGVISMARGARGQRDVGLVHLHQRSAVARLRRTAQSRRPGLRRVRPRRLGHGRRPQDSGGAVVCRSQDQPEAQRLTPPIKIIKVERLP